MHARAESGAGLHPRRRLAIAYDELGEATYVLLETYRKDGSAARTPVWIAAVDGLLYVTTEASTWKVKRLRHEPRCRMAPCNMTGSKLLGEWVELRGSILDPGPEAERARAALDARYGWQMSLIKLTRRFRSHEGDPVILRFDPVG